jgi:hypothetical protein
LVLLALLSFQMYFVPNSDTASKDKRDPSLRLMIDSAECPRQDIGRTTSVVTMRNAAYGVIDPMWPQMHDLSSGGSLARNSGRRSGEETDSVSRD